MLYVAGFFEFLGYVGVVALAFYWGYAGNLILNQEKKLWLKILLFAAMLGAPLITPIIIYAFYYEPLNRRLRSLFQRGKVNT